MLKIASINIERSKHLVRVKDFLTQQQPDVVCLQEVCERDLAFFKECLQAVSIIAQMRLLHASEIEDHPNGIAILSRLPMTQSSVHVLSNAGQPLQKLGLLTTSEGKIPDPQTINKALICATINGFRIATTHHTWTEHGKATTAQLADTTELIHYAKAEASTHGGLLLSGDFNAPRGRASFTLLAAAFQDNIPSDIVTTIDGSLHRAGPIPYVVDGLFTTPNYHLTDVTVHTGVSDHCALTATLHHR